MCQNVPESPAIPNDPRAECPKRKEQRVCIAALPRGETGLTRAEYRPRSATRHGYPRRRVHTVIANGLTRRNTGSFGYAAPRPRRSTRTASAHVQPQHETAGRSHARLSSRSPRTLRLRAWLRQGALPPRPPQGGVAPLTRTSCPPWGLGRKGSARAEYRLVRQRFRSLPKNPRLRQVSASGKSARPAAVPDLPAVNGAQETARTHPYRGTRPAWPRRPRLSGPVANGLHPSAPCTATRTANGLPRKKDGDRQTPRLGRCGGARFHCAGITPPPLRVRRKC